MIPQVSFNDHLNFFRNRYTGVDMQLGFETTITVKPTEHNATEDFKDLDFEQRQCKFSYEQDDRKSVFKHYTRSGKSY